MHDDAREMAEGPEEPEEPEAGQQRLAWTTLALIVAAGVALRITMSLGPTFGDESCTVIANITRFARDHTILPEDVIYPTLYSYLEAAWLGFWSVFLLLSGKVHSLSGAHLLYFFGDTHLILMLPLRLLTIAFDAGCILAAYVMARRLRDHITGLTAALFVCLSQNHLSRARYALPDVPMAFFASLSMIASLAILSRPALRRYLLCGAFAGLAISMKYNGATVLAALLTAHFVAHHEGGKPWRWRTARLLLAGLAACAVAFFIGSPVWLLEPGRVSAALTETVAHVRAGHYFVPGGRPYIWVVRYLVRAETMIGLAALLGAVWAVLRHRRREAPILVFLALTVAVIGRWQKQSPYFLLGIWPAWLALGAVFLRDLASRLPRPRLALGVIVGLLVILPAWRAAATVRRELPTDNRIPAGRWIRENLEDRACLARDWGYTPELYDSDWMRTKDKERRSRFKGSPDLAIWDRFVARNRFFELLDVDKDLHFDTNRLYNGSVRYVVLSSRCYSRFLGEPPPPEHPFHKGFAKRQRFYQELLARDPDSPFRRLKTFAGGGGPTIVILERRAGSRAAATHRASEEVR